VSQLLCVGRRLPSQIICAGNGHLLRVGPFIIVRRYAYLARAIRDNDYIRPENRKIAFNDARGRTYPGIAALIRAAKALAEADARGGAT
jgi:hypothetical protein